MQSYLVKIQISGLTGPGMVTPVGSIIQLDPAAKETIQFLENGVIVPATGFPEPVIPPVTTATPPPLSEPRTEPTATHLNTRRK